MKGCDAIQFKSEKKVLITKHFISITIVTLDPERLILNFKLHLLFDMRFSFGLAHVLCVPTMLA